MATHIRHIRDPEAPSRRPDHPRFGPEYARFGEEAGDKEPRRMRRIEDALRRAVRALIERLDHTQP